MPSAVRAMLGNPSRRPFNENEPKPSGAARCPTQLRPEVRKIWRRLSRVLHPLGLLTAGDADSFALLCVALERWHRAQQQIIAFGEVIRVKDRPQLSPWLRVAAEAEATIIRIGAEFGLSPSARTRLFASPLAPIPTPVTVEQPDISESFFTEGDDTNVQ